MREILFRGFDVEQKKWVYGHYFYHKKKDEHFIIETQKDLCVRWRLVEPESIGQYIEEKEK